MKLPEKIIAVDIETTDSDADIGEIIQIGAVVVNEDLSLGKTFNSYAMPLSGHRNPRAMAVNKISEETLASAPLIREVINDFTKFCFQIGERPMLAAWGAYFDISFIKETYSKLNIDYPFSYRCLDLKTIAIWELAKQDRAMSGGVEKYLAALDLKFEGIPHDGLDDIRNTMKIILLLSGSARNQRERRSRKK